MAADALDGLRPLTGRSVVASTLLGSNPPRLDTQTLVRSGELFGISEGSTRVALSRMASAGELEADGDGYRLAGHLVERQHRQAMSRKGSAARWDGAWRMEIVSLDSRRAAQRQELRAAMRDLRLAEVREGVWLRPDNLPSPAGRAAASRAEQAVSEQCLHFGVRPDHPRRLAARLWDLEGWATQARQLEQRLISGEDQLATHGVKALRDTFVLSAVTLRHLQADPLLPLSLLPRSWPGRSLRASFERFDRAFTEVWVAWYRQLPRPTT